MNFELLRKPFPPDVVMQREGHRGEVLSYVPTHAVIDRLNQAVDVWNFIVVSHVVYDNEVIVVGKLVADGVVKMAFGGSSITFTKNGELVSRADDLKAAASDALKKCATLLGVGLELYGRRSPQPSVVTEGAGVAPVDAPLATEKQVTAITSILRRQRRSRDDVEAMLGDRTGKRRLNELTKREASSLLSELTGTNGH